MTGTHSSNSSPDSHTDQPDSPTFHVLVSRTSSGPMHGQPLLTGFEAEAIFDTALAAERAANAYQQNANHIFDLPGNDHVTVSITENLSRRTP